MTFGVTGSFEDIFDLMFGPQQHDAHVAARRRHVWSKRWEDSYPARERAVAQAVADINAEYRARVARLRAASEAEFGTHQIAAE